jgi:hypothetical protein
MILKENQLKSLREAALPLMQWLNDNCTRTAPPLLTASALSLLRV